MYEHLMMYLKKNMSNELLTTMCLFQSSFAPLLTFKNYAGEKHTEQLP